MYIATNLSNICSITNEHIIYYLFFFSLFLVKSNNLTSNIWKPSSVYENPKNTMQHNKHQYWKSDDVIIAYITKL